MAESKWKKIYKQETGAVATLVDEKLKDGSWTLEEAQTSLLMEIVVNLRVIRQYLM